MFFHSHTEALVLGPAGMLETISTTGESNSYNISSQYKFLLLPAALFFHARC